MLIGPFEVEVFSKIFLMPKSKSIKQNVLSIPICPSCLRFVF